MATSTFDSPDPLLAQTEMPETTSYIRETDGWNPENFAREQIRGMVRQLFFSNVARPVRQVVFSAVASQTDVGSICRQVGEALASETQASVAVVGCNLEVPKPAEARRAESPPHMAGEPSAHLQQTATRVRGNLWIMPGAGLYAASGLVAKGLCSSRLIYSRLAELRREFEYSIVQSPAAGESSEAAALGQLADGIVLVLAAHRTRRATARKIMDTLHAAQVQLLGTVLSERTFPIPEGIYRRL